MFSGIRKWASKKLISMVNGSEEKSFTQLGMDEHLLTIHKRPIFDIPTNNYPLQGCCIPAKRKIYVTTSGSLQICEKAPGTPLLGDVINGVNIKTLKNTMIEEYSRKSINLCSSCWAIRLCSQCYESGFIDGKVNMTQRSKVCDKTKKTIYQDLILYHQALEESSDKLQYLNNYNFC